MSVSAAKVNPDLARERKKASFNPIELTYYLHGGREKTERKRYLGKIYNNFGTVCAAYISLECSV